MQKTWKAGTMALRIVALVAALATGMFMMPAAQAQQPKEALPAPVPPQIFTAKKVFISNAGCDNNGLYHGDPDRLYNEFYAALKTWGRYQLVASPAAADLALEVSFSNPFIGEDMIGGGSTPVSNYNFTAPQFRLVIVDPATHVPLWTLTTHIERARLQSNRDKNFNLAFAKFVNDLRELANQVPAAAVATSQK